MITHIFIVMGSAAEFLRRLPGDMRSLIKIKDTSKGVDYFYNNCVNSAIEKVRIFLFS